MPLIQYNHQRDANSGERSKWIQVVLHDPLLPVKRAVGEDIKGAVATEQRNRVEESGGSGQYSDQSQQRIIEWRNTAMRVFQVPFRKKKDVYQDAVAAAAAERDLTTRAAWSILQSIPSFTSSTITQDQQSEADESPENRQKSVILVSQNPTPTDMELELINTSQIVLNSEGNLVPLETYFADQLKSEPAATNSEGDPNNVNNVNNDTYNKNDNDNDNDNVDIPNTEYSLFTLDLVLMTREPEVIAHATKPRTDHLTKTPSKEQLESLDRMRNAFLGLASQ